MPAAVGIGSVGFDPVGEVMGSMVERIGWGSSDGYDLGPVVVTPWGGRQYRRYSPYADALSRGYATAMKRMLVEAVTIGADGVVGVGLRMLRMDDGVREFTAVGTAVRARGTTRPQRVFSTDLPGHDVAKLVGSGWMPADLVFGLSVAIRRDGPSTRQQTRRASGNVEVAGHTELITYTRAAAREQFRRRVSETGADGAIVSSMSLASWEDDQRNHIAESTVFGTTLVHFGTPSAASSRSLTFLPLRRRRVRGSERPRR